MSHETFDSDPALRTAMHLRELLIGCGTLPPRDRILTLFAAWLDSALPRYSPDTARLRTPSPPGTTFAGCGSSPSATS